jgi:hypothetical protein
MCDQETFLTRDRKQFTKEDEAALCNQLGKNHF